MLTQVLTFAVVLGVAVASLPLLHEPLHHIEHHAPQPYAFGYSIKDHHGEQHREESGTGGHAVKGSYGFTDARGVRRQVEYVADGAGFRAQVKTNEPGTANEDPAAVHMISDAAPYGHGVGLHGYAGVAPGLVGEAVAINGLGYGAHNGLGYGGLGYGGYGYSGLYGGHGYAGHGYAGLPYGGYGLGLASGLLGGLGYPRYGY